MLKSSCRLSLTSRADSIELELTNVDKAFGKVSSRE